MRGRRAFAPCPGRCHRARMSTLYAWILVAFLMPAADRLPPDTFEIVDPFDPLESSLFVDALYPELPGGIVTDLCLVESGGCKRTHGAHRRDGNVASRVRRRALERGWLRWWCPLHWARRTSSSRPAATMGRSTPTRRVTSARACQSTPSTSHCSRRSAQLSEPARSALDTTTSRRASCGAVPEPAERPARATGSA